MISFLLSQVISLAEEAGRAILPIYRAQKESLLSLKQDGSPLTEADLLAHKIICDGLNRVTPDLPIISEESCDIPFTDRQSWQRYWLIDPIDGTKEFLAKNGDFTINIALIEDHQPIMGVVALPVAGIVYFAEKDQPAQKKSQGKIASIHTQTFDPAHTLKILASRRHAQVAMEKLQKKYPKVEISRRGSSLKFCLIAEGLFDLYPRFGITSEWDTAAAQCVLEAAGGQVVDLQGAPLKYGLRDSYQNPAFLAFGDPTHAWQTFFL